MIGKIAFRNLFRNAWRSLLTAGGVAAAVFVLVWMTAFVDGLLDQMVRGATALETGQVQFRTRAYDEDAKIWYSFPAGEELYEKIERVEGVESVEPRVTFTGLIGNDRRSKVSRYVGVDAVRSAQFKDSVVEGRWLDEAPPERPAPRQAVLGIELARQLQVGVGDELVAFASAQDGSLGNDLLKVVGILEAGNKAIDQRTAFLHVADAQFIAAMEGNVHELKIGAAEIRGSEELVERLEGVADDWQAERMAESTAIVDGEERPAELVVRSWRDLQPSLANYLELSRSSMWIIYLVVYFLAALGILNTQRMSALDREREFGVMQAVGMSPRRVFATVLWETTLLTLIGAVVGAALGAAANLYFATYGLNLGALGPSESFSFMGVSLSMRLYFSVSFWGTVMPVLAIVPVAFVCGLWPALSSARLDPAEAIAKRD